MAADGDTTRLMLALKSKSITTIPSYTLYILYIFLSIYKTKHKRYLFIPYDADKKRKSSNIRLVKG